MHYLPGDPTLQPAPRMEAALVRLESQTREMARAGRHVFDHPVFGKIGVAEYVRFSELHARHHQLQLPV